MSTNQCTVTKAVSARKNDKMHFYAGITHKPAGISSLI